MAIRLHDRSRATTDWKCPRLRYLQYEFEGKGVVGGNLSLELYLGTAVHDGLAAMAAQHLNSGGVDIDLIASTARHQVYEALMLRNQADSDGEAMEFANEQSTLVEGLLRGFHRQVWPSLMMAYPVIKVIEGEMTYDHQGMRFMSKPDLVVADLEGNNWYIEYKTTSSKKEGWVNSWNTAVQLHSTVRAIESSIGEKVTGVIVQGLYKGYESYGKQSSPFCYAYRRNGTPPFSQDEIVYEYKAGFKRYPTWTLPGGVAKWVAGMPDHILADQFPQTPPIYIKDYLVDNFFAQRFVRETEIGMALEMLKEAKDEVEHDQVLNGSFPQHFDQCYPGWGKPCGYRNICHGGVTDPLAHGYEYRVPHHIPELEAWESA